jgi:lysophospholipase L1-like esterase
VVILIVKRVPWLPGVCGLVAAMVAAGAINVAGKSIHSLRSRHRWAAPTLVWIAWALMAFDWHMAARSGHRELTDSRRPVLCLGDSLTAGIPPHGGFPEELQKMIQLPVVNFGQSGISSKEAMKLLPDLVEANPQVVVVELGGHDYLKGYTRAATRANLETIIATSRQIGAEVLLMEIPRGIISDPFAGLERELARRHRLELIPDTAIRMMTLRSPMAPPGQWFPQKWHLSDDGLHPNARGNQFLARSVADALVRMYGHDLEE